ncbi:MAG: DEAD/DEAH box helicase [Mycobacteriales bacterium]
MTAAPVTRPLGLRAWQAEALRQYHEARPRDFLVSATPGAGKTRFGLRVAADLLEARVVQRVIVVTPTDHLRTQWAEAANTAGLPLDPAATNAVGPIGRDFVGAVVTYAQVASHPMLHRARVEARRSLVILDEVHHAGDNRSWGEALQDAVDPAARRLALSGTPFRSSPDEKIPYVRYEPDGEYTLRSVPDYVYGYRQALAEQVVRPVMFCAYSGVARWRNSAGEVMAAQLGQVLTREETQAAWRTALNPAGEWMSAVLASADARLDEHRLSGMPDAGGMVLAADQDHARAYAALLTRITGREPAVVLSDEPDASRRIEAFRDSADRWLVAVRMVSEGVDIPRLAVGVYATSAQTPLFFAQAIGRFVRARRRGESATVFLPSVAPLLAMAAELEEERDHVVRLVERQPDDELEVGVSEAPERRAGALGTFEPLESEAAFSHVLFGGEAHTGDDQPGGDEVPPEDEDFLGLPGLLTPEQTAALLRRREAERRQRGVPARPEEVADDVAPHLAAAKLRREVNSLVAQYAHRTGRPHRQVHVEVREACGGPPSAKATLAQLAIRRDWLLSRLT